MYYDYLCEMLTEQPAGENKHKPNLKKFRNKYKNTQHYKRP